jgi:hypothetical protein
MSQNISHEHFNFARLAGRHNRHIKDSLLIAIVFVIGLIGTLYILHFALTKQDSTGYYMEQPSNGSGDSESIYFTASN